MSGTFPTSPEASSVSVDSKQQTLVSETRSGRRQVRAIGSQLWAMTATFSSMTRTDFMPIYSFIISQEGQLGVFQFIPPVISSTSGTATGSITTSATGSIGVSSISVTGHTGSLKAGDFVKFSSHSKVYMLTSDRSGAGTMSFKPALMRAVGSSEAVTYTSVPFTVRLNNDVQSYSVSGYDRYGYEIDMVESL